METFLVGALTAVILTGFVALIKIIVTGVTLLVCLPRKDTQRTFTYLGRAFDADRYVNLYKKSLYNKTPKQIYTLRDRYINKTNKKSNSLYKLRLEAIQSHK